MTENVTFKGESLVYKASNDDGVVIYIPRFREHGIKVPDGGTSIMVIDYCPFCGKQLPSSLRDEWFTSIENMAIDPRSDNVPVAYKNDMWWS